MENKDSNRRIILKKISDLIKRSPSSVIGALNRSNVFIESVDKISLADAVAYNIVNNRSFQNEIAIVIANDEIINDAPFNLYKGSEFSNFGKKTSSGDLAIESVTTVGSAAGAGAQSGGWIGAIVGAVVGAIDAGFGIASSGKKDKISEIQAKQEIYDELFEEKKKTNWIPIAIVGGVIVVGGLVTYLALRK